MIRLRRLTRSTSAWLILAAMGFVSLPAIASCCPAGPEAGTITPQKTAPESLDAVCGMPCCGHRVVPNRQLPPLTTSSSQCNFVVPAAPQALFERFAQVSEAARSTRSELDWSPPSLVVLHAQFLI